MQADVYTAFLTNKVKVFATKKGIKPFKTSGRLIRKAYPFLLCSAMVLSGCSQPKTNGNASEESSPKQEQYSPNLSCAATAAYMAVQDQDMELDDTNIDWDKAYKEVVKKYRLNALKDKVPFSEQEIFDLMNNPNPPHLLDTNFNHCAENQHNFWEIVRNGISKINSIQKSDSLTENQKKEYKITAFKMLSQMSKYKGSDHEVDITDYNNQKTFLFFEKVIKYQDHYNDVIGWCRAPGYHDERTEFLGRYYKDFKKLAESLEDYPHVEKFIDALYTNDNRFILTPEDQEQANAISKEMFQEWFKKQHIEDENLYAFTDNPSNSMEYGYMRGTNFWASVLVQKQGKLQHNKLATVWGLVRHEIQHLGQLEAASNESPEDNNISAEDAKKLEIDLYNRSYIGELGPTLSSIAWEDYIYKKIHGIDYNAIVDYGVTIDIGKKKIPLGIIGPTIWEAEQENPSLSIDAIIGQPKILKIINDWGDENSKLIEHELQHSTPMIIQYQR